MSYVVAYVVYVVKVVGNIYVCCGMSFVVVREMSRAYSFCL